MTGVFLDIYYEGDVFYSESDSDSDSDNGDRESQSSESESSSDEEREFNGRKMFPRGQTPKSMGEFFNECVQRLTAKDSSETKHLKNAFAKWERMYQYENDGASLEKVSLKGWGKYHDCSGDENIEFRNGFHSVLEVLMENIPSENIKLSKPVTRIEWQTTNQSCNNEQTTRKHGRHKQCKLTCGDGSVFDADFVILTPSVGFMKENEATLFNPPLPDAKRTAFKNMGVGLMNKIFLIWEKPFWEERLTGYQFLWCDDTPVEIKSAKSEKRTKSGKSWYQDMRGFETIVNQYAVLETNVCGEQGIILESLDDQEVMDVCVEILEVFTKSAIPKPKKIVRSFWHGNPYFRGTYSLLTTETPLSDHDMLGDPLPSKDDPVLLFAGEAYSRHHFSASHGALETGWSAANRIIKTVGKQEK